MKIKLKNVSVSPELEKFLKKNRIWSKYVKAVSNDNDNQTFLSTVCFNRIGQSFFWGDTEDGHDFWCNWDCKFEQFKDLNEFVKNDEEFGDEDGFELNDIYKEMFKDLKLN